MTFKAIGASAETLRPNEHKMDGAEHGRANAVVQHQATSGIATWLGNQAPTDMDKAAVSRASSHGVKLSVRYEGRYPTGPNGESLPSYEVAVGCRISGTDEQRAAAKADLVNFLTPAPVPQIERWLAELSVLTAGRGREGFDAELMVTALSSRLSQFPADVVRYALLERTWKWFPTWAELEGICRAKSSARKHMIAALSMPEPDPEPERRPPTREEKDRIAALIAEKFPDVPQHWRDRALEEVAGADQPQEAAE